jgi:hypothetical protein
MPMISGRSSWSLWPAWGSARPGSGAPAGLTCSSVSRSGNGRPSTPAPRRRLEPTASAAVDLEKLRRDLAATIERAKIEDPRELRKRIAGLEAELRKRAGPMDPATLQRAREEGRTAAAEELQRIHDSRMAQFRVVLGAIGEELARAVHLLNGAKPAPRLPRPAPAPTLRAQASAVPRRTLRPILQAEPGYEHVSGGERKILTVLAQYPQGRSKRQVAILAAYAVKGGAFQNYLGALRTKGFVEGRDRDLLRITEAGMATLGAYDPLPAGRDLLEHWLRQLGRAERMILQHLAEIYPAATTKEELGIATGYEPSGGGFANAVGKLRTLELIEGRGELRASEELFEVMVDHE